jgi:hypothetical protein
MKLSSPQSSMPTHRYIVNDGGWGVVQYLRRGGTGGRDAHGSGGPVVVSDGVVVPIVVVTNVSFPVGTNSQPSVHAAADGRRIAMQIAGQSAESGKSHPA